MTQQKKFNFKYLLLLIAVAVIYFTGMHKPIIATVQRGILKTGLLNPDLKQTKNNTDATDSEVLVKADLDVSFYNEQNELVSLKSLSDKPIFLNFWATWCPPCIAEMPGISNLYQDQKDEVNFVLVSFDTDFQKARDFKAKKGYTFPIYRIANDLPDMYNTGSLPTTICIDAQSNLALTHMGMADYDTQDFRNYLNSLK
ncbi:TlpA family protein disulfide reductase [Leeuwenhoekiella sp. MAR_2009_132]|uniref:TlpA family protein disulfide reductase n=1 Tax=Leeuwenhoekiella sp. MAR_2009_132 TaxID=1392489 RepID=UPI00048FB977|nr:TlpA disulfide reductase family protein [Leeuwenhoekiella sp. MAR_2009_132]